MANKSKIYQLYELRDELKKTKKAIEVKDNSERLLLKVIFESHHEEDFKDLIKGFTEELKSDEISNLNLNTRIEALQRVIALHEKNDENKELVNNIVTDILVGLGLVYHDEKEKEKA